MLAEGPSNGYILGVVMFLMGVIVLLVGEKITDFWVKVNLLKSTEKQARMNRIMFFGVLLVIIGVCALYDYFF
ncbi:hypothetical protein EYV94_22805 [Puteibacter caeruleilacunae]|nr:hypothetical protein EYV94_22805 [Puteibacter caeruleilacunae]